MLVDGLPASGTTSLGGKAWKLPEESSISKIAARPQYLCPSQGLKVTLNTVRPNVVSNSENSEMEDSDNYDT